LFDGLGRHLFSPVGAGVDVAVSAGLVAEFAEIDLQDLDPGGGERGDAGLFEGCCEVRDPGLAGVGEDLPLGGRLGEGAVLAEKGKGWHGGGPPMAVCAMVADRVW
jgi:hypothetical protein